MEDVHGKEISLQYVTVKVPGQKPRGSKTIMSLSSSSSSTNHHHHHSSSNGISDHMSNMSISISNVQSKDKRMADKVMLTAFELLKEPSYKNGVSAWVPNCIYLLYAYHYYYYFRTESLRIMYHINKLNMYVDTQDE